MDWPKVSASYVTLENVDITADAKAALKIVFTIKFFSALYTMRVEGVYFCHLVVSSETL